MNRLDGVSDDEKRITSVDVSAHIDQARDALRAHRTQVDPDGFWFQIPAATVREVYPFEDFERLAIRVGWDEEEEGDLFAGI